jgi:Ca2+-binding EF-hand superfamily protein
MTPETCALFIKGCTGEHPSLSDERITGMFKLYDSNSDGFIERQEFINFYEIACRTKGDTVRENLRHHNIRADLKKLSEVKDVESFDA